MRKCPKVVHFFERTKNLKENPIERKNRICTTEVEDLLTNLSHFQCGKETELANEPVDPASEQNYMGPPGQFLTSFNSFESITS